MGASALGIQLRILGVPLLAGVERRQAGRVHRRFARFQSGRLPARLAAAGGSLTLALLPAGTARRAAFPFSSDKKTRHMDPNYAYQDMLKAMQEHDHETARELALALKDWFARGGFYP
jgi:hypothetical protein